jgi:putative hemolysin
VDGLVNLDEFTDRTAIELPEGPYETVAGFVMARLGRIPAVGQSVEVAGHRLEVMSLDGRRVATVRVSRLPDADDGEQPAPDDENPAGFNAAHA